MKKVILDTNFLVYCAEQKIDYKTQIEEIMEEGFEFIIPIQVINELKDLTENSEKLTDKNGAKLALKIIESNKIKVENIPEAKYADDAILKLSKGNYVATLDNALRKKVGRAIVVKSKRKIAFG